MQTSSSHKLEKALAKLNREAKPICYECDKPCWYLFDDARCADCTRLTPEEVRGEEPTA